MILDFYTLLNNDSELLLFILLGLGYLLGSLKVGGFQLGATSGVLIVGLIFGHFQFELDPVIGSIGFLFFIYSVGLQAGPSFFSIVLENGTKYFVIATLVVAISLVLTWCVSLQIGFEPGIAAGLLSGALTSAGALAAAQDAVSRGLVELPPDFVAEQVVNNIAAGYAITYLYGIIGLSILVSVLPKWFRIDLEQASAEFAGGKALTEDKEESQQPVSLAIRAYEIKNPEVTNKPFSQLFSYLSNRFSVQQIKRGSALIDVEPTTKLELGDYISVILSYGDPNELSNLGEILGPEVFDSDLVNLALENQNVIVSKPEVIGLRLSDLPLGLENRCYVTRLRRIGRNMPLSESIQLQKGDVVTITGLKHQLNVISQQLGTVERAVYETDLLIFAFGIVLGCVVGATTIQLGGLFIKLGTAGGLLLSGILFGFLRSIYPTFGRVPSAARWLMRELGLLFFVAAAGVRGGHEIVAAFKSAGPALVVSGILVTTLPPMVGYLYGTKVLKLNPALLMGALTGAMTSTPALGVITKEARSSIPALGYAGTYTFANVFLTIAGSLAVRF